jgi:hypothetical protein
LAGSRIRIVELIQRNRPDSADSQGLPWATKSAESGLLIR